MTTYTVSTVTTTADGRLTFTDHGKYRDKIAAMNAASRIAKCAKDCVTYGPNSLAYFDGDVTSVVSWGQP